MIKEISEDQLSWSLKSEFEQKLLTICALIQKTSKRSCYLRFRSEHNFVIHLKTGWFKELEYSVGGMIRCSKKDLKIARGFVELLKANDLPVEEIVFN